MIKVSVVVPTFNRGYLIQQVLNNMSLQTWKDFEVIVVDDGSNDNTEEILKKWCSKNSRTRYVKFDVNRGISAARNAGISNSDSEYIAFLDSDDRWHPTKLEEQMRVFQNSSDIIGLIHTGYTIHELNGRVQHKFPRFEGDVFRRLLSEGKNFILISSVIVPRKILDDVGLFDEHLISSQDYDLWLRITKKYPVRFVPKLLVDYYTTHSDRLSLKPKLAAMDYLLLYRKFQREIELFNVRHRFFYFLAKSLLKGGKSELGRAILLKAIRENPKDMRYILFLAYSFLIKWDNYVGSRAFDSLSLVYERMENLFRRYTYI